MSHRNRRLTVQRYHYQPIPHVGGSEPLAPGQALSTLRLRRMPRITAATSIAIRWVARDDNETNCLTVYYRETENRRWCLG